MVRYWARGGKNDYSTLPVLKCIGKDQFLPPLNPRMGSQDYCLGQPRKTLAYAKALQYWAEKAKTLLPGKAHQLTESILELRQAMEPHTTFQDSGFLGDDTIPCSPEVCHTIQGHPRGSFLVAHGGGWLGASIGYVTQTFMPATPLGGTLQQAVPTDQPSTSLQELEESAGNPHEPLLHDTSDESCGSSQSDASKKGAETRETEKDMVPVTPVWTQIHPFRAAVPVELVPKSLGEEHCCCHSCSCHSDRRDHLWAEQVQQSSNISGSAPGSLTMTCDSSPQATSNPRVETSMQEAKVRLQAPPLGFADIASILWKGQPLQTLLRPIEEQTPTPMVGFTMVMSQMIQDVWVNLSVNMVTCQLSVMGVGPTSMVTVSVMTPQRHCWIWLGGHLPSRFSLACTPHYPILGSCLHPWFWTELFSWHFHPKC